MCINLIKRIMLNHKILSINILEKSHHADYYDTHISSQLISSSPTTMLHSTLLGGVSSRQVSSRQRKNPSSSEIGHQGENDCYLPSNHQQKTLAPTKPTWLMLPSTKYMYVSVLQHLTKTNLARQLYVVCGCGRMRNNEQKLSKAR